MCVYYQVANFGSGAASRSSMVEGSGHSSRSQAWRSSGDVKASPSVVLELQVKVLRKHHLKGSAYELLTFVV